MTSASVIVINVTPSGHFIPMIAMALREVDSPYTPDQLVKMIQNGDMSLAGIYLNGLICGHCSWRVAIYPEKKKLVIETISGTDYAAWGESLTEYLKDQATKNDCVSIIGAGRVGWERLMKGFKKIPIITMEMEV